MCHVWGRGVLVRKREGKRPLGRPRRRWEDNIKTDPQEVEWGHGLDEPSVSIKCGEFLD